MPTFRVQYDDGPALTIDAADAERAWDEYKHRTRSQRRPSGIRRRVLAEASGEIEPPTIEQVSEHVEAVEPARTEHAL
jgi:hypothetical protein